jgi:hypothetical protein
LFGFRFPFDKCSDGQKSKDGGSCNRCDSEPTKSLLGIFRGHDRYGDAEIKGNEEKKGEHPHNYPRSPDQQVPYMDAKFLIHFILMPNGPGLTGHGMDGSKLACESPARNPVQPMVRARLRGAIHWLDAVSPGPFTAARKRRPPSDAIIQPLCLQGSQKPPPDGTGELCPLIFTHFSLVSEKALFSVLFAHHPCSSFPYWGA